MFNLMDFDYAIIEKLKYKDIEIINQKLNNNTILSNKLDDDKLKEYIEDIDNLKKLLLFYKIYTAFYNFIEHISDDKETKNYTHFLDLQNNYLNYPNYNNV